MKFVYLLFAKLFLVFALVFTETHSFAQVSPDDESDAIAYSKKYKDDDVLCISANRLFTFDKGENPLGDKVVEIEEASEYEFISLKKYSAFTFTEYYNQFIKIKNFKKTLKYGNRLVVSDKNGIDRSVTDDGIFFDDSRVRYFPIRFNNQGAIAKINVKKTYTDGKYLTTLYFNDDYPINEQVIEFKVPDWLSVDFKQMNFEGKNIDVQEKKKGGYTTYLFILKNTAAYKSEYKRIGRAFTDAHIIVQIKSFESKGETLKGFDKVDDVYAWNNRLYLMAKNDKTKLQPLVTKLTQNKANDSEKIKAIYYWVQDNIRYIAYEDGYSGYIPSTTQDVVTKKYGDCKGMANLLTEMLKLAGYDAHFTWIGTRSIPYPQTLPAMCVNNHAICSINFGGKTYFLDGTENYVPFGENAFRIQGKEVMIANGNTFEIKKVPTTEAKDNLVSTKADFILTENGLKGKARVILTGNQRTEFQQSYQTLPSTSKKEYLNDYLEFGNDNMVAANIKTSDLNNRDIPVTIEGDVDLSNTVNNISGSKYVGIDFFPKSLDRLLPDEKRVEGYDLNDVLQFDDEISLTIPAGKKFIDKPDDLELKTDGYTFTGKYILAGNKITLSKTLAIKKNIIAKADILAWAKFIENIKEFNKYFLSITNK
ncbi:MAG: transglutaminase domain-containing protein [Ferruginibacter sp.]|nr:transglutaminase domain-containing protein [Ferruginibacter sp.]